MIVQSLERKEEGEVGHTFLVAVSVNVVAAEENTFVVTVDELLIPADYFSSRCLAKVLGVEGRVIAVSVDVLSGLLSDLDGITECLFELSFFGAIARLVDREALNLRGGLGI